MAKKTKKAAPQSWETAGIKSFLDMIAPSVVKFEPDHFICGNTFRCVWALREYPTQTDEQAILRHLGEKDGITLRIYTRQVTPAEEKRIIQNAANKNRMGSSNTNDLQQTITAESNLQDVASLVASIKHHRLPTHVNLNGRQCGLHNESTIMLEQLRTLDKQRLLGYAGTVGKGKMQEVNTALEISIGIKDILPDNKRKRGSDYGKSEHREEKHQADPDDH